MRSRLMLADSQLGFASLAFSSYAARAHGIINVNYHIGYILVRFTVIFILVSCACAVTHKKVTRQSHDFRLVLH